jgi:UPF0042 nucleotide-binding protein
VVEARPAVWILTGPSGAGKLSAVLALEEAGVEYVDNLPVDLIEGFVALPRERTAVAVIDARQGDALRRFDGVPGVAVLFLDARDDVLLRRIGERKRPHPAGRGKGRDAVNAERAVLAPLRAGADVVIDTSDLSPEQLRERVRELVATDRDTRRLTCTVSSFGYKYGPQLEADWVIDSRLMANPFWVPELRSLTGLDASVREFVMNQQEARRLLHDLTPLISWAAERCTDHRRFYLHVAIGCTGGRHRSVVLAEGLAERLRHHDLEVEVRHRDVERPDHR